MNQAQKDLIASEGCGMTTLCATVIAPLKYHNSPGTFCFVFIFIMHSILIFRVDSKRVYCSV